MVMAIDTDCDSLANTYRGAFPLGYLIAICSVVSSLNSEGNFRDIFPSAIDTRSCSPGWELLSQDKAINNIMIRIFINALLVKMFELRVIHQRPLKFGFRFS